LGDKLASFPEHHGLHSQNTTGFIPWELPASFPEHCHLYLV